ncbi:MAG: universal stress protein [Pirellulales bacterium]|nr:universal stress protein [Pirellulales bacterium]
MLNSVLLHLAGTSKAEAVIRLGVALAQECDARLRAVTLYDTRRAEAANQGESAVYAALEQNRRATVELQHEVARARMTQACLGAGLDFDVRRAEGNPLQVLARESRFHDVLVTSPRCSTAAEQSDDHLSRTDLIDLLRRGVYPLLAVHPELAKIERVLMIYEGSEASGRAIRSFVNQGAFGAADHRLLAIGKDEGEAKRSLREMADYCLARRPVLETGFACGKVRHVVPPYAQKWQADLVVMGAAQSHRLMYRLIGDTALDLLDRQRCAAYVAA